MSLLSQKPLTSLPIEILAIIVRMARNQDSRLKDRLARSRARVATATKEVMKLSEWYGKSLLALYATCKTLETLAKPFVFESVRFSKSSQDLFLDHVLPSYGHLIKEALFDDFYSSSYIAIFHAFLMAMNRTPTLQSLVFQTPNSIREFTRVYKCSQEDATTTNTFERSCRPLFASLSQQVTHLTCLETSCSQMKLMAGIFPKLKYLKRRLLSVKEMTDSGAERRAYLALEALEELDLSSMDTANDLNLTSLTTEPNHCEWDRSWFYHSWHTVSSLSFSTSSLLPEDWYLLKTFRHSLKVLNLASPSVVQAVSNLEEDCVEWPQLTTVSVVGDQAVVEIVLLRLKLAPIATLHIRLINCNAETASCFIIGEDEEWTAWLPFFATSLRELRVDSLTLPYANGALETVQDHCNFRGLEFQTGNGSEETACFVDEQVPFASIDAEDHPARQHRAYAHNEVVGDVKEVLNYASKCVEEAEKVEDWKEMHRLASLLRGVAAKKLMEGD